MDEQTTRSRNVRVGLIACDLVVNTVLLRWQRRMREGSVEKK